MAGSRDSVVATGAAFIDTLWGNDFMEEAVATVDGKTRATTRLTSYLLTFQVTAADISAPGTRQIRVKNPGPGGGPSDPLALHIVAPPPPPVIDSLGVDTVLSDRPVTVEVYGANFTRESRIRWNDSALATSRVSSTHLSTFLPAALLATAGTRAITVVTPAPGGGASGSKPFTVVPAPVIVATTPDTIRTGGGTIPFRIHGHDFGLVDSIQTAYQVTFATLIPSARTDTTLDFQLDRSAMEANGTLNVRLLTRFGNTPFALVKVKNPVPTIAGLSPDTVDGTELIDTVIVTGTGFLPDMYAQADGLYVPTEIIDSTHLRVILGADLLMTGGTHSLSVYDGSGPATSNLAPLVVRDPAPVADSMSGPAADSIGSSEHHVLWGTGFRKNGALLVNGIPVTPDFLSVQSYAIDFNLPAAVTGAAGTLMISWRNDAPGGGVTDSFPLPIIVPYPAPQLSGIDREYLFADSGDVTAVLKGQGFIPGSRAELSRWADWPGGGLRLTSTRLSDSTLQVIIPAEVLGEPHSYYFRAWAADPTRGPSNVVTALGLSHGVRSIRVLPFGIIDMVGDPVRDRIYALRAFTLGQAAWLLAIDATTGTTVDSLDLSAAPAQELAIASDGSALYLVGPGLGILAVDPVTLTTLYAIPEGNTPDSIPWQSVAVTAGRDHPGRIAVLRAPTAQSSSGWQVRLIENGVVLPDVVEVPIEAGPLALGFAPGDSVLVALTANRSSGAHYRRISVGPSGLAVTLDVPVAITTGYDAVVSGNVVLTEDHSALDLATGAALPPAGDIFAVQAVARGRSASSAYLVRQWTYNGDPVTQIDRLGGTGGPPLGAITLPRGLGPTANAMATWGTNGFAVGGSQQVIIGTSDQTSD
ncbi:MAG TPA: hypothetical protein VG940_00820 [Gemmatimonadales bacterium]|nr:hypothetical protein [Gemmatimonadales bacterium]